MWVAIAEKLNNIFLGKSLRHLLEEFKYINSANWIDNENRVTIILTSFVSLKGNCTGNPPTARARLIDTL